MKNLPEYIRVPIESLTTWPVRSTSMQELMAVTLGFWETSTDELTHWTSPITRAKVTKVVNKKLQKMFI